MAKTVRDGLVEMIDRARRLVQFRSPERVASDINWLYGRVLSSMRLRT